MKKYLQKPTKIRGVEVSQNNKSSILVFLILAFFGLFYMPHNASAEGTRELMPASTDNNYLLLARSGGLFNPFALYNAPEEWRLHISVCEPNERIYIGMRLNSTNNVRFRLRAPDGSIVVPQTNAPTDGQPGYIANYNRAVAGPQQIVGPTGYNAIEHIATQEGNYYIEFSVTGERQLNFFDITVASPANVPIPGRLWSRSWSLNTMSYTNRVRSSMFIYADDGIVTEVDFGGMQPFKYVVSANSTGTTNTGNFAEDRQSTQGLLNYPQYRIFLNNPDEICFPTGTFGQITSPITISGCHGQRCIDMEVDQTGSILILLDLNGTPGYQPGSSDRQIQANVIQGQNCIPWDGLDGLGQQIPNGTTIDMQVDYLNGITHIPLFDVEYQDNGFLVGLTRPVGPAPALFWDDTRINGGWRNLTGCTGYCHTWIDSLNINNRINSIGEENTINTWWYANIINTNVPFDFRNILVDANTTRVGVGTNNDTTICANAVYQLSGAVQGANGGIWSTTGTGTFSNNTDLTGTYTPSTADITTGFVMLTLTSTGNGECPSVSDSLVLSLVPGPSLQITDHDAVCANNSDIDLSATFTVSTGVEWTGGNGNFVPNNVSPSPVYQPTEEEANAGTVTLVATTTGNGICPAITENITVTINPSPIADAGADSLFICDTETSVQLNGSIDNAPGGEWIGGAGTFTPNRESLDAVYQPTAGEIASGELTLILRTEDDNLCNIAEDDLVLVFIPTPTINAGADGTVCTNATEFNLSGTATNTTAVTWTGGNGAFSNGRDTLVTTYTLSQAELDAGTVTLYLQPNDGNVCSTAIDSVLINVNTAPIIEITPNNLFICANNAEATITANVTGSNNIQWTGGNGTYLPNANTANITYIPSATEIASSFTTLFLSTLDHGNCTEVRDTLTIIIAPSPVVDAGEGSAVCRNNPNFQLDGFVDNATDFTWSGGSGSYTPNAGILNAIYNPTQAEINSGSVTLTLTATRQSCIDVTDQVTYTFTPEPTVEAGPIQSICSNNPILTLQGSVVGATGVQWVADGVFVDENALSTNYTPTAGEIASGSTFIYIETTGNGNCNPVRDSVAVTFTPSPTVNPGTPLTVCANNSDLSLNGQVTVANGGEWSGGAGQFVPNRATLNATYRPSVSERNAGSVTLTLQTTGNGNCSAVSQNITHTITPAPQITNFNTQTRCANAADISLSVNANHAGGIVWSGGQGSFTPNNTSANATYNPTTQEIQNGTVTLTATTSDNGLCNAVSLSRNFNFQAVPVVEAGANQVLCGDVATVNLSGVVTGANGAVWSTSGNGSFSPANQAITTYTPSNQDVDNKTITLTLRSTGNGVCQTVEDQITVTFTDVPSLTVGPNETVCSNSFPIQLIADGSAATWTGGTGIFTPDRDTHEAIYTPSASELNAGTVTLTITTIPSGACPELTENVTFTLLQGPDADAGDDIIVCGDRTTVALNGVVNNATGGYWSTSSNGSFSAAPNVLQNNYIVAQGDTSLTEETSIRLFLSTTGNGVCATDVDSILITFQPAMIVQAGPTQTYCETVEEIALNGSAINAPLTVWSGGVGSFDDVNDLLSVYRPTLAETQSGSIQLTLTAPVQGVCGPITNNVTFNFDPAPVVDAGDDQVICADSAYIQLNGTVVDAVGGYWVTDGQGIFSPNFATLNARYFPAPQDTVAGILTFTLVSTGSGACDSVTNSMQVVIQPAPKVTVPIDFTVCANETEIPIEGVVTLGSDVQWRTSGTGTFADVNAANTTYTPSAQDINNGGVTLSLRTINQALCKQDEESFILTIQPTPVPFAGFDLEACADAEFIQLNGAVSAASGGTWTSLGTGAFVLDTTLLNTRYAFSAADTSAGSVQLVLSTTGNGVCPAINDTLLVTILPKPIVNAGDNITVCADNTGISLNGSVSHATGGLWTSSGNGQFYPNNASLNASYVLGQADINQGSVRLFLQSDGNGSCIPVIDTLEITITPAPTANAGGNVTVCADTTGVPLNGQITVATGGVWRTSGTGSFGDSTALATIYIPTPEDTAAGLITITLLSTGNGDCMQADAQKIIRFTPLPVVDAGDDITLCATQNSIPLQGTVSNASSTRWSSAGLGTFTPNPNNLNGVSYLTSSADTAAKQVQIILTAQGQGRCKAVSDSYIISFEPEPIVVASTTAMEVCGKAQSTIQLDGSIIHASGGIWSSNGTGNFSPSNNVLTPTYSLSNADANLTSLTFVLTTSSDGLCASKSAEITVPVRPAPIVNAGVDADYCQDVEYIQLQATSQHTTGVVWSTNGSGVFVPNATTLNAIYSPSFEDSERSSITLSLSSTGDNVCESVIDNVRFRFNPAPTVDAGGDLTVCLGIDSVGLNGFVTIAEGATWTSFGTGTFFPNDNALDAVYLPSADDQAAGSVDLRLRTYGEDDCLTYEDIISINFSDTPPISAGSDKIVCLNDLPVQLEGVGTTATWSLGDGTFAPSRNSLTARYTPTAAELSNGSVELILTTIRNGTCIPGVDTVVISFQNGPEISTFPDTLICVSLETMTLNATIGGAAGNVAWSTEGNGTFNTTSGLSADYSFSNSDKQARNVRITASTTDNGLCSAVSQSFVISMQELPVVNAGQMVTVCENNRLAQLSANLGFTNTAIWSGGGGDFSPSETSLNPTYLPTDQEADNGSVTLTLTSTDNGVCPPQNSNVTINITPRPSLTLIAAPEYCETEPRIPLSAMVANASNVRWTSTGTGQFNNPNLLQVNYNLTAADTTSQTITFTATTTGNGNCLAVSADTTITLINRPFVKAAANPITVCSDVTSIVLEGLAYNTQGTRWSTQGTGIFASTTDLSTTYTPSASDRANGGVIISLRTEGNTVCLERTDVANVQILSGPGAQANAGFDQIVCADVDEVVLQGAVTRAQGGIWSGGDGVFTPNNTSLQSRYIPTAADTTAGSIQIILTTTGNGICQAARDTIEIDFLPQPIVTVPTDLTVCADTSGIELIGAVSHAGGLSWSSSGTGTFALSNAVSQPRYSFTALDTQSQVVTITARSTGNGTCKPVQASLQIDITPLPIVDAGPDLMICATDPQVVIEGAVENAGSGNWTSSGNGSFAPNAPVATYQVGDEDVVNTAVFLTLTSIDNGLCRAVNDQMQLRFVAPPMIDAGADQTVCADVDQIVLNPLVQNIVQVRWTTTGTGTFVPNPFAPNAIYRPSAADRLLTNLNFTLTSENDVFCDPPASSTIAVTILPAPTVNAGIPIVCTPQEGSQLLGTVLNAVDGRWSTSGTGSFSPTPNSVNSTYFPSLQDVQQGSVNLTLTSTGNGTCKAVSHTVALIIEPLPIANAGPDRITCRDNDLTLVAQTAGDVTYRWYTDAGVLLNQSQSVFVNIPNDRSFVLEVTDKKGCNVYDTINVRVFDLPILSLEAHYCQDQGLILDASPAVTPDVPGVYQWTRNNNPIVGANTAIHAVRNSGTHTVSFSFGGCATEVSADVTPLPFLISRNQIGCIQGTVSISTSQIPQANYQWSFNNAPIAGNSHRVFVTTISDTNTYRVTVRDSLNCVKRDSLKVIGIFKPQMSLDSVSDCVGESVFLDAEPTNIDLYTAFTSEYRWYRNFNRINHSFDTLTVNVTDFYTAVFAVGQCKDSANAEIRFEALPVSELPNLVQFCSVDNSTLELDPGDDAVAYLWEPTGDTTRVLFVSAPGIYQVLLTNEFGCESSSSVEVVENCPPRVFVPTAFVPGSSGPDAFFTIFGTNFVDFSLTVYNRWGEVIFFTNDRNIAWDGTYKDEIVPVGVYAYKLEYEGDNPENRGPFLKEGQITVVK